MNLKCDNYILITVVKNEQDYIEKTIQSVIHQTLIPLKWIIVDDFSTDNTAQIIKKYEKDYPFIKLIFKTGKPERNFGSKATAVMMGYDLIKDLNFNFIGNLDADVSFDPMYYENMINILKSNPKLGIVGGDTFNLYPKGYIKLKCARNSVGGPFQFFRRECFDQIGGYQSLNYGGIDALAEIQARMNGWDVKTFQNFHVLHYRITGSANSKFLLHSRFKNGIKYYSLGDLPLFFLLRLSKTVFQKPFIIGSISSLLGFIWASVIRYDREASKETIKYLRNEQKTRLYSFFRFHRKSKL